MEWTAGVADGANWYCGILWMFGAGRVTLVSDVYMLGLG